MADSTKRRRVCLACGSRFTTYEQVDSMPRFRRLYVALQFGRDPSS
jgi:transcriptional regulator NrdR family protein